MFNAEVGVCLATSGPGSLHLLGGLLDAKGGHVPLVENGGQQSARSLGSDFQQEVALQAVFSDVCSYCQIITEPAQARHVVDRAMRIAASERAITCIIVPNDVQIGRAHV